MMIETQIEIAAPPATVRSVLLDFDRWPEWSHGRFKSVVVEAPGKTPRELRPGDYLNNEIGMKFRAIVAENSETLFRWTGLPTDRLLTGVHSFHFDENPERLGTTIFRQTEAISGYLWFLASPWLLGGFMESWFSDFNRALKERVESMQA